MRAITRIGFGPLLAAAALACVFAPQPARAQVPICHSPSSVPGELLSSIALLVDFSPTPGPELCDKIASAEVKGCIKAVQNAAKCNDVLNNANAKAASADCSTLADPSDQKSCSDGVQAELSSLTESIKNAAAAGTQACADLSSSVLALCLGDMF